MAKAFKIKDHEKLEDKSFIVHSSSFLPKLEEIKVIYRGEIAKENAKKSHSSVRYQEVKELKIFDYMQNFRYKVLPELPEHVIFEDGNIWFSKTGAGGERFLSFSTTAAKDKYYYVTINNKVYHVDILICMAFLPLEGRHNYDDYKTLKISHKDGDKLNNNKDNLEWDLNYKEQEKNDKRIKGVIQYENIRGEKGPIIRIYKSIAEAFRETEIGEQEIRDICNDRGNLLNKKFLWSYKEDNKTEDTYYVTHKISTVELHLKILDFINSRNYKLLSDINSVKTIEDDFVYLCSCGKERIRSYQGIKTNGKGEELNNINYIPSCCIEILSKDNPNYKWHADKTINTYIENDKEWRRVHSLYWASSKCDIIGSKGESLIDNGIVKLGPKIYTPKELTIRAFNNEKDLSDDAILYFEDIREFKEKQNYLYFLRLLKIPELINIEWCSLTEFSAFKIYKNGAITKNDKFVNFINVNNRLIFKNGKNPVCADIVMIMTFKPYNDNWDYQAYLKNCYIYHIDEDYSNCRIENLKVIEIDVSKAEKVKVNRENRINEHHDFIKSYLEKCGGTLITSLDSINSVDTKFNYKCKCGVIYNRTITNIKECGNSNCKNCRLVILNTINTKQDFEIDGKIYKRIDYGWVSDKGDFVNNLKENIIVGSKDNLVLLGGKNYNAKHVIAKAFKIQYYEHLESDDYVVKTKDKTTNYSYNNLYVWASKKELYKSLIDSYKYEENVKIIKGKNKPTCFLLEETPNCNYKEFDSIIFYENGIVKLRSENYTRGNTRTGDYLGINTGYNTYLVHRVICYLFNTIEGKSNFEDYKTLDVNHKDGNKHNNSSINLEWVSKKENMKHAIENGLCNYTYAVNQYSILSNGNKGEFIKTYPCIKYAIKESGQSRSYIMKVCLGKTKSLYKYYWEFVNPEDKLKYETKKKTKLDTTNSKPEIIIEDEDIPMIVPK
jgi:hypothetical protein